MAQELAGKVAIITGGASGIGRGTVELYVQEGAKVVIADINAERGEELAKAMGPSTRFKRTDVAKADEVQALVDYAVSEFGGLHIMFNNAGLPDQDPGSLLDNKFESFSAVMNVNLLGVMLGTQRAAQYMVKHGGGAIINTSSIGGTRPGYGFFSYRAAKAGVVNFTQSAAVELGQYLIRVNCIAPGNIPTDMGKFALPEPGMTQATADRIYHAVRAVRMTRQPLKRQGTVVDIAQAAVFLGSDRAAGISGLIMPVDAGATAGDALPLLPEIIKAREAAIAQGD